METVSSDEILEELNALLRLKFAAKLFRLDRSINQLGNTSENCQQTEHGCTVH